MSQPDVKPPTRSVVDSIEIAAPADVVWRALTEAAELERWFPLVARVEPGVGGRIHMSWQNEFAGELEILEWRPDELLVTGWSGPEGDPMATPQTTELHLRERGGRTVVRLVASGIPAGAEWDEWYDGTRRGWRFELHSLKVYLERHRGEERTVVYLRRRVDLPAAEAMGRLSSAEGWGPTLPGTPFVDEPGIQYAAVIDQPPDSLLRLSIEPSLEPGRRDATAWLSAWGADAALDDLAADWRQRLERLFPEGETV
jgi:uncharacterized protein YndB with AHSA1/START domain